MANQTFPMSDLGFDFEALFSIALPFPKEKFYTPISQWSKEDIAIAIKPYHDALFKQLPADLQKEYSLDVAIQGAHKCLEMQALTPKNAGLPKMSNRDYEILFAGSRKDLKDCISSVAFVIVDIMALVIGLFGINSGTARAAAARSAANIGEKLFHGFMSSLKTLFKSGQSIDHYVKAIISFASEIINVVSPGAILGAIWDSMSWWDWLITAALIVLQLTAWIATGGLALFATIAAEFVTIAALVNDATKIAGSCDHITDNEWNGGKPFSGPPVVTVQPQNRVVSDPHEIFKLFAESTGIPKPSLQWQLSEDYGQTWKDIPSANTSPYSGVWSSPPHFPADSTSPLVESAFRYRAEFKVIHPDTGVPFYTDSQVATCSWQTYYAVPEVVTQPRSQTVNTVNQVITVTAAAKGNPAPSIQWQSSDDDGQSWHDISRATGPSYSDHYYGQDDGHNRKSTRSFRAVFTNVHPVNQAHLQAYSEAATCYLSLTDSYAPVITTYPKDQIVNDPKQPFTLVADAVGKPAPTMQWEKLNTEYFGQDWEEIPGAHSTTLTDTFHGPIVGMETKSTYLYRVRFSNPIPAGGNNYVFSGGVTCYLKLLNFSSPVISIQPKNQFLKTPDQKFTLTASAIGEPNPTIQWQQSVDQGHNWVNIPRANSISYTDSFHSGYLYRAQFMNVNPNTRLPFYINSDAVTCTIGQDPDQGGGDGSYSPPTIKWQPRDCWLYNGNQTVSFSLEAIGSAPISIQWQRSYMVSVAWDDIVGATSKQYSGAYQTGYKYRAVVTNKDPRGNVHTVYSVTVSAYIG